jgi:hypothetical protein
MIQEMLDPAFLKRRIADLAEDLRHHSQQFPELTPELRKIADEQGVTAADLEEARNVIEKAAGEGDFTVSPEQAAWLPCDPHLSIVQSAFEEFYVAVGAVQESTGAGLGGEADPVTDAALKPEWLPDDSRPFMRQTEQSDVFRWGLSFAAAKAISALRKKPKFEVPEDILPLQPKARLVLMGDWASGVPRARNVAEQIKVQLNDPDVSNWERHVIHLGDTYYAGLGSEYRDHLGKLWPVAGSDAERIRSWCLNGNHDMYSGGRNLFEFLCADPRFTPQAGCTWFGLENEHWLIFGLDTAFESQGLKGDKGGLAAPQAQWIMEKIAARPNKKIILLSHHQPFSAWEGDSPLLLQALDPLIKGPRPIDAWFWGHEHRCAVYKPAFNIRYPALIGHGGVPVYASSKEPKGHEVLAYRTRSFSRFLEKYSYMGFAVLDLDGPKATVRYLDENGDPTGDPPWDTHKLG